MTTATGTNTPGVGERGKGPVEFNHAISYVNKIKVSHTITRLRR